MPTGRCALQPARVLRMIKGDLMVGHLRAALRSHLLAVPHEIARAGHSPDTFCCTAPYWQIRGSDLRALHEDCRVPARRTEMDTEPDDPTVQLDPLVVGHFASGELSDLARRMLLEQQSHHQAGETAEKMAERARLMFVTLQNGPHSSGMLPCRLCATNGLLELVSKAAHALWTAHRSEIRAMCPELWDEELTRGWLLADSLGRWFDTGAAVRTVGKRAAAQTLAAAKRARAEGKRARTKAPQPEARDAAAEAARKEVWAEAYGSLLNNLQSVSRPRRPSALALVQSPAAINMPTTCPAAGEPRQPSAAADLTQADCCLLRYGASASPAPPLAVAPPEPAPAPAPAPAPSSGCLPVMERDLQRDHTMEVERLQMQHRAELGWLEAKVERLEAKVEQGEKQVEQLEQQIEKAGDKAETECLERLERNDSTWKRQYDSLRKSLDGAHERSSSAHEQLEDTDQALELAEWTITGGYDGLAAWLPPGWTAEEAKPEAGPRYAGEVIYRNLTTKESMWHHPGAQLWEDTTQVTVGNRPPAYETFCRRCDDEPPEQHRYSSESY